MATKYKDIGKAIKDLFKKGFNYDQTLEFPNKSVNGITATGGFSKEGAEKGLTGFAKIEAEDTLIGDCSVNLTKKDEDCTLEISNDKLAEGLKVSAKVSVVPDLDLEANYVKDSLAVGFKVNTDFPLGFQFESASLSGHMAFSHSDASLGLSGEVDLMEQTPTNYDAALQYNLKSANTIFSLVTQDKFKTFLVGLHNTGCCDDFSLGAHLKAKLEEKGSPSTVGTFGFDWKVNPTTNLKAHANTEQVVAFGFEHRLSSPPLKFNYSHELKPSESTKASRWGFGLSLGDY